jgi:hypothetical protein
MTSKSRKREILKMLRLNKQQCRSYVLKENYDTFILPTDIWKIVLEFFAMDLVRGPRLVIEELNVLRLVCKGMDTVRLIGLEMLSDDCVKMLPQGFDWKSLTADPMQYDHKYIQDASGALGFGAIFKTKSSAAEAFLNHFSGLNLRKTIPTLDPCLYGHSILRRSLFREKNDLVRNNRRLAEALKSFSTACYENSWYLTVFEFRERLFQNGFTTFREFEDAMKKHRRKSRYLRKLIRDTNYDCKSKNCIQKSASACQFDLCGLCCRNRGCFKRTHNMCRGDSDFILATSFLRLDN